MNPKGTAIAGGETGEEVVEMADAPMRTSKLPEDERS
jgi:hypothetical protein